MHYEEFILIMLHIEKYKFKDTSTDNLSITM